REVRAHLGDRALDGRVGDATELCRTAGRGRVAGADLGLGDRARGDVLEPLEARDLFCGATLEIDDLTLAVADARVRKEHVDDEVHGATQELEKIGAER